MSCQNTRSSTLLVEVVVVVVVVAEWLVVVVVWWWRCDGGGVVVLLVLVMVVRDDRVRPDTVLKSVVMTAFETHCVVIEGNERKVSGCILRN